MDPHSPTLQELPPRWARFCLSIGRFAAMEIGHDFTSRRCLVACSGGPDSTALLRIAALLCRRSGGSVCAAHLNHCLRAEAGADAVFVAELCRTHAIPFFLEKRDVAALARKSGIGEEEAGRAARYAFLKRVMRETEAEFLLVGHQLNDLAEDQLLRMLRGAGWPALGGMAGYDPARRLLRPLLLTPKATLEAFLRGIGQPWRIDATNADCETLRNRMRHGVLPALLAENPAYLSAAARHWRQARMDGSYWDAALAAATPGIHKQESGVLILTDLLMNSPAPLRVRLYKAALEAAGPGQALCDGLFQLDELWQRRQTGKAIRFPGDKEARIVREGIRIQVIDRKKTTG